MIDEKDITDDVMEQWKEINEEQAYKGSALEERLKLTRQIFTLEQENTELEAQIEKMKCCFNCSRFDTCSLHRPCRNYNEWKLRR